MFLSEWRKLPSAPCLVGKKNLTARASMLLKSRASLTCFRACFLPGRAKDLSAPRYIDILRRIRDAVRWKGLEKWRTNSRFVLHDNAPAHRSVLVKDFLAKNNVTTLQNPPHSPDLAPCAFTCFLQ